MIGVLAASFFTAGVEWVEAFTIVLAVALSIGWRQATSAGLAALAVLALLTIIGGIGLAQIAETSFLRFIIGAFLLLFGLRWLGKAIARAAGLKPLHDEAAAFAGLQAQPEIHETRTAWLIAFNGVLLEGLEVWLIVVALGVQTRHMQAVALAALAALAAVVLTGVALRGPLARVPENAIKFAVGSSILGFGSFWVLEALGYQWPLGELSLPALIVFFLGGGLVAVPILRRPAQC